MFRRDQAGILLLVLLLMGIPALAQSPLVPGAAPDAARITLAAGATPEDVIVTGADGAVFPRALVFIRNLLTGETVRVTASPAGAFSATLRGTPFGPYLISPAATAPDNVPAAPGDLPGGPAVLIHRDLPPTPGSARVPFSTGGTLARGAAIWLAEGDIAATRYAPGDTLQLTLEVRLLVPEADAALALQMRGQLGLLPLYRSDGFPLSTTAETGNGWSSTLTRTGLAVDNLQQEWLLGESVPVAAVREGDQVRFTLTFAVPLPPDLPAGMYAPVFTGLAQVGNSEPFDWYDNVVFSTAGSGGPGTSRTRLPLVLTVGTVAPPGMLWTLLEEAVTDGGSGALPTAAALFNSAARSNRVRYPAPTVIVPPGNYPLEPYLPALLPNRYDVLPLPALPLALPGGEVTITVTRPDARVDRSPTLPFEQLVLSSPALDERTRQGSTTPMNLARLTTLDPLFSAYPFDVDGIYDIALNGAVNDTSGHRYSVTAAYRVLVAQPLALYPAVLPGTPFTEGDTFQPGLTVAPGSAAEVTVTLRFFPLGNLEPVTRTFTGRATRNGYFYSPETFVFEGAGEYVVEYEVRYTDSAGRLWAASQRSAGVVAGADSGLTARGRRGLEGYTRSPQAWFDMAVYPVDAPGLPAFLYFPYYAGDVLYLPDNATSGIRPIVQVQDNYGQYTQFLRANHAGFASPEGSLERLIALDALPVLYAPGTYAYISAVRPDVTVAQFVQGDADGSLPVRRDNEDVLAAQIGAGAQGQRPGDYIFLFGGVVTPQDSATYAALAVITAADDTARVLPPFSAPLLTRGGQPVTMFLHPTGTRPGQVLAVGHTLSVMGQVAPTLPLTVAVEVTAPSGRVRAFSGPASATGYFYVPAGDFMVDEPGVWTVTITTGYAGPISTGLLEAPYPAATQRYTVYVTDDEAATLTVNQPDEVAITPGNAVPFVITIPRGWTNVQAYYTVATPAAVLAEGRLTPASGQVTYSYSPATLARDNPTLETRGTGLNGVDVVRITFAVTATDENGQPIVRTRLITLMTDRLLVLR
ncbi:MAG: hypothetical protein MUE40_02175 [Anaerolineae bacterium]|nr:hypothetical protein [Anaerolineae bacterium]